MITMSRGKGETLLYGEGAYEDGGKGIADYVVTEYGIARLMGKTAPERVNEVAIARPDFRVDLRSRPGSSLTLDIVAY
jgi:hypothetical protein